LCSISGPIIIGLIAFILSPGISAVTFAVLNASVNTGIYYFLQNTYESWPTLLVCPTVLASTTTNNTGNTTIGNRTRNGNGSGGEYGAFRSGNNAFQNGPITVSSTYLYYPTDTGTTSSILTEPPNQFSSSSSSDYCSSPYVAGIKEFIAQLPSFTWATFTAAVSDVAKSGCAFVLFAYAMLYFSVFAVGPVTIAYLRYAGEKYYYCCMHTISSTKPYYCSHHLL
jgi:hypothetical protein